MKVFAPFATLPNWLGVLTLLPGSFVVLSTFGFTKFVFTVVGVAPVFGVIVGVPFASVGGVTVTFSREYNLPSFART